MTLLTYPAKLMGLAVFAYTIGGGFLVLPPETIMGWF